MRFDGEGQRQGLPLRGMDGVVVVERVGQFGRAVPEPPLREEVGLDGGRVPNRPTGRMGCPYGGWMRGNNGGMRGA